MSIKHICLFTFFAIPAFAQVPVQTPNPCITVLSCYFATISGTVASSGTSVLTIQQPVTGFGQVNLQWGVVTCPGQSFNVDQAQNGTAATTTAGTIVSLDPTTKTAKARVFTASNVGAGTSVAPTLPYTSGSIAVVDLSQRTFNTAGGAVNYTITLTNTGMSSCTGTVSFYWSER